MSITLHVEKIFYNPLKFCLLVYAVNITSTGDFGKNNFKVINVTVTEAGNTGLP